MNIPIYRAKKIDNDEWWVEGFYYQVPPLDKNGIGHMIGDFVNTISPKQVDPNTLSIHFPNMIDKNGKKIFASLSEDGVGGDYIIDEDDNNVIFMLNNNAIELRWIFNGKLGASWDLEMAEIEVIGIHKGE